MLQARDLWVSPPGARDPVIRGVSLEIARGEWVALAGPNGGGKTTLLHALAGLWPVARGSIEFEGARWEAPGGARANEPARSGGAPAGIAVVLQDPGCQLLTPSVAEEIAFTSRNLGHAASDVEARVSRWARRLGLEADLGRDPRSLSAGRQQLVLLAGALVASPRLLLADEPTAHLDPASRELVRAAISAEVRAGLAVLWVTQDGAELAAATRVVAVGGEGQPAAGPGPPPVSGVAPPGGDGIRVRARIASSNMESGPRVACDHPIEIEVPSRGITVLMGPNGSGKSVLLGAFAGLGPTPQIEIEWLAPPVPPPILTLQYPELQVFEDSVAKELVFAARSRGVATAETLGAARRALVELELEPEAMLARRTWTLSTGEKRLIEVVAALIAPASLILLDEPTGGLDATRKRAVAELVRERSRSAPVMLATQDREWAGRLDAARRHHIA